MSEKELTKLVADYIGDQVDPENLAVVIRADGIEITHDEILTVTPAALLEVVRRVGMDEAIDARRRVDWESRGRRPR